MSRKLTFLLALLLLQGCCWLGMGDCEEDKIEQGGIALSQVVSKTELPSKITISFKADLKDGQPVTDIDKLDLKIYEDDVLTSNFESQPDIVTEKTNFAFTTVLLLDLSGSILDNNSLPPLKQASKSFINSLFTGAQNGTFEMAIYWFDGDAAIHLLKDFTNDKNALLSAIDSITEDISSDNSTNLNGAIVQGVSILEDRLTTVKTPDFSIVAGGLVIFTDGTDQAARVTESVAVNAVRNASDEISIFTIGLGGEINKSTLEGFGRHGFEFADQTSSLTGAFDKLSKRVLDESKSYYIFQYCSPKRSGTHTLKLEVIKNNKQGSVVKSFSANGFSGGCKVG